VQVLIINLPSSKSRLKFQVEQLKNFGLDYQVIEAVGIDTLLESDYKALSQTWQRPMRNSEVACFLSHKKLGSVYLKKINPVLLLKMMLCFLEM
jgi:glycosyl transferase family 25